MNDIKRVTVIGAGPAGLTAALRLKQANQITPIVYEIRQEPTSLGGAIGIPSNGLRLLYRLGLFNKLLTKGAETPKLVMHSTKAWSKEKTGFGYVRVRRADLMDVLLEAVREAGIPVHYGKHIVGITEANGEITSFFSDGTSNAADFLLGCDGIHSTVRKLYLLSTASSLDNMNATLTSDGIFGLGPTTPNRDLHYWFFSREVPIPATGDARDGWGKEGKKEIEEMKSTLLSLFEDEECQWMDMLRDIVRKTDAVKFYPIYKVPPGRPWSKGRCLIMGDAAHAMPPHASQGLSMALEDAFLFSKLLQSNTNDISDGLRAYEEKRRTRTEKMLKTTEQRGGVRQMAIPLRRWATELAISGGLWVYNTTGLEKLGFGQRPLAYDVDDEQF
ncbi:hypothetical protein F4810DRAFT_720629 [Camillea tinctor]|nr:hypothetical protein F4810DRAFT_720629 [Camillea tinctor]